MSFKINDNRKLEKYTKIWGKVGILINIVFDNELVSGDNDKYIKAKIKSYGDKTNTNFQGEKYQTKMHHTSVCSFSFHFHVLLKLKITMYHRNL